MRTAGPTQGPSLVNTQQIFGDRRPPCSSLSLAKHRDSEKLTSWSEHEESVSWPSTSALTGAEQVAHLLQKMVCEATEGTLHKGRHCESTCRVWKSELRSRKEQRMYVWGSRRGARRAQALSNFLRTVAMSPHATRGTHTEFSSPALNKRSMLL